MAVSIELSLSPIRIWRQTAPKFEKKMVTLLDLCVSSLRRGHANLLCIVPILTDDPRRESAMAAAAGKLREKAMEQERGVSLSGTSTPIEGQRQKRVE